MLQICNILLTIDIIHVPNSITVEFLLPISHNSQQKLKCPSPESIHAQTRPIMNCRTLLNVPGRLWMVSQTFKIRWWSVRSFTIAAECTVLSAPTDQNLKGWGQRVFGLYLAYRGHRLIWTFFWCGELIPEVCPSISDMTCNAPVFLWSLLPSPANLSKERRLELRQTL